MPELLDILEAMFASASPELTSLRMMAEDVQPSPRAAGELARFAYFGGEAPAEGGRMLAEYSSKPGQGSSRRRGSSKARQGTGRSEGRGATHRIRSSSNATPYGPRRGTQALG